MAYHFRELLIRRNWRIDPIEFEETQKKSKKDSIVWMLRNGTPWFFKRSFDLFPAAILLMSIELMLLAVNTNFVAFSHYLNDMHGQVFVFFILTVAAAESAIGLAILVLLFRSKSSISVDELNTLKG